MTSHDKAVNLENNINTRDQRNAGIWLIVLVILFVAFLYALGLGHAPSRQSEAGQQQQMESLSANSPPSQTSEDSNFSVNQPVGAVELPGTVGKQQHFLTGHGNTPVPAQGVSPGVSPNTAENAQSFSKAKSGSTASDQMQTGKNYKNGMESGATGGQSTGTSH
ncbi:MAG TPA: hypothetical protein V6D22_20055 [Candidatus Obscuribacterales bacterium]